MSWTKKQFITQALAELGLGDYIFNISPEELQSALRILDSMMATWNGKGIRISYPLTSSPGKGSLNEDTTVPDSANEAIYTNLAKRLAPGYGKIVSPETKEAAKEGYQVLLSRATHPGQMQLPGILPLGAGHKAWQYNGDPFVRSPVDCIAVGPDGDLELNN